MGRPAGWMEALTGRSAMKSPGRAVVAPGGAAGVLARDRERAHAATRRGGRGRGLGRRLAAGGSGKVAGCRSVAPRQLSGRYLSFAEREEIAILKAQGIGVRETARRLGRAPSTISRELRRNAATRCGQLEYRASVAQWKAELVARRPKTAKLAADERLREYVQQRLAGEVRLADGTPASGPGHGAVEGPQQAAPPGPPVGERRGARSRSRSGSSFDFPDDPGDADLARGDLPGALRAKPRRAQARAGRLPADRPGAAGPARPRRQRPAGTSARR